MNLKLGVKVNIYLGTQPQQAIKLKRMSGTKSESKETRQCC